MFSWSNTFEHDETRNNLVLEYVAMVWWAVGCGLVCKISLLSLHDYLHEYHTQNHIYIYIQPVKFLLSLLLLQHQGTMKPPTILLCLFSILGAVRGSSNHDSSNSSNTSKPSPDERARSIVSQMRFSEKFRLLHGVIIRFSFLGSGGFTLPILRLNVPGRYACNDSLEVNGDRMRGDHIDIHRM